MRKATDWAEHTPYREMLPAYSREGVYLVLARVYLAEQRYPDALQLLATLLGSAEQVARVGSILAILALQVVALQASGDTQEALRVLYRLLAMAEPEGFLRVFLDAGAPMRQALQALLVAQRVVPGSSPVPAALISYASTILAAFEGEQRQTCGARLPGCRARIG